MSATDRWVRQRLRQIDTRIQVERVLDTRRATRRQTEALVLRSREARWKHRRGPLTVESANAQLRHVMQTSRMVLPKLEAEIARCRAHVAALCLEHRITVEFVAAYFQGYAFTQRRMIEAPEIFTLEAYSTSLHEIAHVVMPCESSHRRVETADGRTCCVRCEIRSWVWAQDQALVWDWRTHSDMREALLTYRRYGTPREQAEIDALVSPLGFREAQLRRARRNG